MVNVFIDIESSVGAALRQVLALSNVALVRSAEMADLIVVESARDVGARYRTDVRYAILDYTNDAVRQAPSNVRYFPVLDLLCGLLAYIEEISPLVRAKECVADVPEMASEPRHDARTILVIEDTPRHQVSARKLLIGHRLTVATGYDEAMELMGKNRYEVVLSDLSLPMSSRTLSDKAFVLGALTPYGLLLALEAARQGAKYVTVVTDLSHHDDPISAAFDHFSEYLFQVNGTWVRFTHAPMTELGGEWVKDWRRILEIATRD